VAIRPVARVAMKSRRVSWPGAAFLIGAGCALLVLVFAASLTWALRVRDDSLAWAIGALVVIIYGSGGAVAVVSPDPPTRHRG
jgi:hypothetical protein